MPLPPPLVVPAESLRRYLVSAVDLLRPIHPSGVEGAASVLDRLGMIQVDAIDRFGRNHDLVVQARADGTHPGDLVALLPRRAVEFWSKERSLLPVADWPRHAWLFGEDSFWSLGEREALLLGQVPGALDRVLDMLASGGPATPRELDALGPVDPFGWGGGWTTSRRASGSALDILWSRGRVVVAGRRGGEKVYDLPARALPEEVAAAPPLDAEAGRRWMLLRRVESAGLLSESLQATWSALRGAHRAGLPAQLVKEGALKRVTLPGSRRAWYAPADVEARIDRASATPPDGRVRVLAPLDPLVWDRRLVQEAFGFDYVWEVYKPASQRTYSYYAKPILWGDRLVGRIDLRRDRTARAAVVEHLSVDAPDLLDPGLAPVLAEALGRLLAYAGLDKLALPRPLPPALAGALVSAGVPTAAVTCSR